MTIIKKNIFYYNNIEIDKFIKLIQSHIFTIEEVSIIFNIDSKYVLDFINLYASKHNIKINIYTINKNIIMIVKTLLERNIEQYIKNKKINKQIQEIIKYIELEINEYIKNNNDMNLNYLEKKLKISNKTINNLLINI